MKTWYVIAVVLMCALATPLHAETYAWVDESGTYNFSEDFSHVPKKYRTKVLRRGDMSQETPPALVSSPAAAGVSDAVAAHPVAESKAAEQLFGGKTREAWRKELGAREAELREIEQRLKNLQQQLVKPTGVSGGQLADLKRKYDDTRGQYDQTYSLYSALITSARQAGLAVEIRK